MGRNEQIPLPPRERDLPCEQLLRDEAREVFTRWLEKDDRIEY